MLVGIVGILKKETPTYHVIFFTICRKSDVIYMDTIKQYPNKIVKYEYALDEVWSVIVNFYWNLCSCETYVSLKGRGFSMKANNVGQVLLERLEKYKMVAAIKDIKNIERAIKYKENLSAVLLMTGSILNVKRYVDYIQSEGLPVILHVDKIGGLEMDHDGIDFIKKSVRPCAIVTTKSGVIKRAKFSGILVIQRIFLIDTDVYNNLLEDANQIRSDIIEIMPSRAPDFINKLTKVLPVPIITGGLLNLPQYAKEALDNGALAITTSNSELWKIDMNGI